MGSCECAESSLSSAMTLQEQREMLRSVFPGRCSDNSQDYEDDDEGRNIQTCHVSSQFEDAIR